jgi:hypothetical protein
MGKIKNNPVTNGFTGKLGDDIVFRQVDNKTIFAKRTVPTGPPTAGQSAVRDRFAEATMYAGAAMDDPQASMEYKLMATVLGVKTAFVAAVTDFLTLPQIARVYTRSYKGQVGDIFSIKPTVPYKAVRVDVTLLDSSGAVIESGSAVANQLNWRYIATKANANIAGCKLVLTAYDRLDQQSTFEKVL